MTEEELISSVNVDDNLDTAHELTDSETAHKVKAKRQKIDNKIDEEYDIEQEDKKPPHY